MSSQSVRTAVFGAVEALANPWPVFDLSQYESIDDILPNVLSETVLIQYIVADDQVQNIAGEGNQGWEETGSITIHMVVPTGFDSDPVVDKGDQIRIGLRGRRIAPDILIESCSPFVDFGVGGGINGAVHQWASNLFYSRRDCG